MIIDGGNFENCRFCADDLPSENSEFRVTRFARKVGKGVASIQARNTWSSQHLSIDAEAKIAASSQKGGYGFSVVRNQVLQETVDRKHHEL